MGDKSIARGHKSFDPPPPIDIHVSNYSYTVIKYSFNLNKVLLNMLALGTVPF